MKSLRELYKIGYGPSSSHTMGPHMAAKRYLELYPQAKRFKVTLYGSLPQPDADTSRTKPFMTY